MEWPFCNIVVVWEVILVHLVVQGATLKTTCSFGGGSSSFFGSFS